MEKFENVNCVVCESEDLEKISDKGQFGIPAHVCICKRCGLSFLNPRWTQPTYQDFYQNKYDKYYRSLERTTPPEEDPCSYYPILMRMQSTFGKDNQLQNILDIGSGDGSLLNIFIEKNVAQNYYAIEPSASHKEKLNSRGIHFISNDVDADWHDEYENQFDLIIMRHVLEHMLDPLKVLQKLKKVLTKNGMIYIAVPDAYHPVLPFTDFFFRAVHTYYFNRVSLKNLLHKAGYEVLSLQEGDHFHNDEMFVFGKKSKADLPIEIEEEHFETQKKIFAEGVARERLLDYRLKSGVKKMVGEIVKVKKKFFPKPIFKK